MSCNLGGALVSVFFRVQNFDKMRKLKIKNNILLQYSFFFGKKSSNFEFSKIYNWH